MKKFVATVLASCALPIAAFAAGNTMEKVEHKTESAVQKARTAIYKWTDKDSVVIDFDKGSAKIADHEKKQIRALLEANRQKGQNLDLTIAAWSDRDYMKEDKKVKASQRETSLAERRLTAVKNYIKAQKMGANFDQEYNMAKDPSRLAALFNTRDAEVKKGVARDQKTNDVSMNRDIEALKDEGGAQKVVIALPEIDAK